MTDTSGSSGFGGAGAKIRLDLKRRFGGGGRSKGPKAAKPKGGQKKPKKQPPDLPAPSTALAVIEAIWRNLETEERLEAVLMPPEILYYLKAMARLIEKASQGGLPDVIEEFEIRETSTFNILRRRIINRAPGNSASESDGSEHHSRAGGAFLVGSAEWAEELTGQDDPTQVLVSDLVEVLRRGDTAQRALVLSPRKILEDYGERVIRRSIRKDDEWGEAAAREMIREYHQQINQFFAHNNSPAQWREKNIEATLKTFPPFVLTPS